MNNNTIWIKNLDKLVKEYNNSYHRTIKMKPIDASKKSNENIVRKNYNFEITNKKQKFSIGDKVRISILKNTFEKGYTSNWSEQVYIIDDIKSSNVHYYYLKDLNGNKIDGMFYEHIDILYNNDSVPKELYNHFKNSLTNLKFKNKKIPVHYNDDGQILLSKGEGFNNNKIKIN